MKPRGRLRIPLLALFLLALVPLTVQAQSGGWSVPHTVVTTTRSNWFPSLAVDPRGDVHLVWSSGTGDGEEATDLLMYASLHAGQWRQGNDILVTGRGGWAARNSLAIDRSGRLHLLVRNRDAIYYTSAAPDAAWSAQAWQPLRRINGLGQPYYSTIGIDAAGTLHVAWEELSPQLSNQACIGCSDIWYRRSTDGGATWSAPVNPSNSSTGSIKPQFVFGTDGAIFLLWDEGKDPNAVAGKAVGYALVVSEDGGRTWTKPLRQSLGGDAAQQATLAADGAGPMVLVFRATDADTILFRTTRNHGRTWSAPSTLPGLIARDINDTPWDKYSMASDSAGNVHLLAVGRTDAKQPTPALYHMVWSGGEQRWQAPEVVSSADYPEWPQLVIAQGNQLHVAWFTRNSKDQHDSDHAAYQVSYSTRTVAAPQTTAPRPPTPTRAPEPPAQPLQPTAAPPAPLSESQRAAPVPISARTEIPLLRSVGITLLPALGLCLVALAVVARRRFW